VADVRLGSVTDGGPTEDHQSSVNQAAQRQISSATGH
jgi:hypothetical protein